MLQTPPRYAIERGALSVNPQTFAATTASATAHTFTLIPPFVDVFWSRYLLWRCTSTIKITVTVPANLVSGVRLMPPGMWSLAPFPNTQLISTIQATFNNCTVTTQLSDTLDLQLRMCALAANNSLRFAPCKMDRYALYEDAVGALSNITSTFDDATDSTTVPNGAVANWWWVTADGTPCVEGGVAGTASIPGYNPTMVRGVPTTVAYSAVPYTVDLYLRFTSIEPLWLSPLIFSDVMEGGAALTGVKTASVVLNMRTPSAAHILRVAKRDAYPTAVTNVSWAPAHPQVDSEMDVYFLTPPLSLPKAPACVIPYMDVPRYPTMGGTPVPQMTYNNLRFNLGMRPEANLVTVTSNVVTLSQIPDLIAIFVRPRNDDYAFATGINPTQQGRWLLPIYSTSLTFNNRSGLLAGAKQHQLFEMTRANGIRDLDWNVFRGYGMTRQGRVGLAGSPIVLRATDWGIDDALAPGLNGAWSFQVTVQTYAALSIAPPGTEPDAAPPAIPVDIVIVPFNSGFFITREGESERVMGVLTAREIIQSSSAPYIERGELARTVGAGMLSLTQHAPGRMMGWHAGTPAPAATAGGSGDAHYTGAAGHEMSRTVGGAAPSYPDTRLLETGASYARSYRPVSFADNFRDDGKRRRVM